ncbi:hypothetical protein DmAi_09670 [Acetobacter persici]|uniref:Uncharacterized protein n=1 Tax=Acetobacter persici TaxID=1076596 RepID=A0A6V8I5H4_9PROT|nr:hypothetical protein DmAi_09670 [Acetobacter persici]
MANTENAAVAMSINRLFLKGSSFASLSVRQRNGKENSDYSAAFSTSLS